MPDGYTVLPMRDITTTRTIAIFMGVRASRNLAVRQSCLCERKPPGNSALLAPASPVGVMSFKQTELSARETMTPHILVSTCLNAAKIQLPEAMPPERRIIS
ncbi:hypothetical protein [Rhizobium sp. BK196]|uniref:hypothetical protein n=1 Tax=Rhizobium sp. BK196 TaxID=2587073 RepID=UPI00161F393D|nr:hypothetical protein [Rhizobium sp. BK196]